MSRTHDKSLERFSPDAQIFDLDKLIVDTESVVHLFWLSLHERNGCSLTEEEWSLTVGGGGNFHPLECLRERSRSLVEEDADLLETIESQIEVSRGNHTLTRSGLLDERGSDVRR